ncbi:Mth938-like domain-containing protein [Ottowia thiooxydans]|uniref:Mth938-like domain-containing protein n=1 Tax=Ottowia thiooxydans TaxID=219182 RepID=UPI000491E068|nr:Mth938-like domain-containing protein [Ottowia thiooxydans]
MKFQPDLVGAATISGYGPDWIAVGNERVTQSLVLHASGERSVWDCDRFEQLSAAHFARLIESTPELVIFGSGSRLRFPRPEWLRSLIEANIGIETMDTPAACRTYNILAGEGRRVVVALLIETAEPAGQPKME